MTYELRPLERFSSNPAVRELCRSMGADSISQRAAQVAAWHLANGMSWQRLRDKEIVHLDGRREGYFSSEELWGGMDLAARAVKNAAVGDNFEVTPSLTSTP